MSWRPLETLPVSHYATAQRSDRSEVDVYRVNATSILNVSTGKEEADLTGWQPRTIKPLPIDE